MSVELRAPESAEFDRLMADLLETWARLPATEDGSALALSFARAAYGAGYVRGLTDRPTEDEA